MRIARVSLMAVSLSIVPSVAFAADPTDTAGAMSVPAGFVMLVAAAVLLIVALSLARVADGSAVAENISYVVAACACLGASVLASWASRILPDALSASQASLGSDMLIVVATVLFSIYFWRVRSSLRRFLSVISSDELLARAQGAGDMPPDGTGANGDTDA